MSNYPPIPKRLNMAGVTLDKNVIEGRGEQTALYFGDTKVTFRELQQRVNACGNALRALGLEQGDRFAIRSNNCPEYLVAFLAGLKIGCVPIPTNSLFRVWELEHILTNSGAKAVLTTGALLEPILEVQDRCPSVEHIITFDDHTAAGVRSFADLVQGHSTELEAADTASDDTAFIIYTSGTTGEPKGVEHAHRWIVATGDPISNVLMRLTPEDICFSPLEVSFIYALGCNFLYPY
ncbi:MAG: AMP-dependent synthetase, partial [Acidobacteria bacterium]|nr:AMP-dependent synthetase [Acidobacteriota bacterium]